MEIGLAWLSPEQVARLIDPAVHLDMSRRVFNPGTYDGHEGLARFSAELAEVWSEFQTAPERLIEAGDDLVVFGRRTGRARESGVEVQSDTVMVWTVRDGRIARLVTDLSREEAFSVAGLPADA